MLEHNNEYEIRMRPYLLILVRFLKFCSIHLTFIDNLRLAKEKETCMNGDGVFK